MSNNMKPSYFMVDDFDELKSMFKDVYAHNPLIRKKEYFDWQFKQNPYTEDPETYNFLVSKQCGRINGFIGFTPFKLYYKGEVHACCDVINWFAKDSALLLLSEIFKKFYHRTYFAITDRALGLYRNLKVPILMKIPRYLAIFNKNAVSFFSVEDKDLMQKMNDSYALIDRIEGFEGIEERELFDDKLYSLVWKSAQGFRLLDGKYLNWRYVDIPFHNYKIISNKNDEFAVIRKEKVKDTEYFVIRVLEWNFLPTSTPSAIGFIKKNYVDSNTLMMDFFSTLNEAGSALIENGFFYEDTKSKKSIPYLFRPTHNNEGISCGIDVPPHREERNLDLHNWYITKGWSDIDRFKC